MKTERRKAKNTRKRSTEKAGGIGFRVRHLRKTKELSMQELAQRCYLTASTISQLERNLTNPSIAALRRIGAALGVPVFYFFMEDEPYESLMIVRANRRKKLINPAKNVSIDLLSPNLQQKMEVMEMRIDPGVTSSEELFTHVGEEACIVLEGKLTIQLGNTTYSLNEGDCIQLNSDIPHRYINKTKALTRLIVVVTPPSF